MAEPDLAVGDRVRAWDWEGFPHHPKFLDGPLGWSCVGVITEIDDDDVAIEFKSESWWYAREDVRLLSAVERLGELAGG